jgi:DNA-directed RNA polymerase subunit RPC12/RpoP
MAALIKCPKCGSTRLEEVKVAEGLAGKMGVKIFLCVNCGKESKIKDKKR